MSRRMNKFITESISYIYQDNKQLNIATIDELLILKDILSYIYGDLIPMWGYISVEYKYLEQLFDKSINNNTLIAIYNLSYIRVLQWNDLRRKKKTLNDEQVYYNLANLINMIENGDKYGKRK